MSICTCDGAATPTKESLGKRVTGTRLHARPVCSRCGKKIVR